MENASACLCLHKWPIFRTFAVCSCTTKQLDELAAKVKEIWTKCGKYVIFQSHNRFALNKNVILRLLRFFQVVQKQTLGEVGT